MTTDINEFVNNLTAREDDDLWGAYDENGTLFSLHVGPEPEFSQDEGMLQINLTSLSAYDMDQNITSQDFKSKMDLVIFYLNEAYDHTESTKPDDLAEVADRIEQAINQLKKVR